MFRRWSGRVAVVAALVGSGVAMVPSRAASPPAHPGDPELGPLIAGESSLVDGTLVWTDYAYDDRGPNTNGLAGGDATYPDPPHPANTADLIQLQLGTDDAGRVEIGAVLSTLVDRHEALLGVGFDTDRDTATGAPTLPGGAWKVRTPIGIDRLVLARTDGVGMLLTWNGRAFTRAGDATVTVDRARNVVRATVPALRPGSATWRTVGAIGPLDGASSWLDGSLPIHDLAFVRGEDPTDEVAVALREQVPQLGFVPFQDRVQADVLAGKLTPGRAVASARFGTTTTQLAEPDPGFNTFLYHSRVRLPEGVERDPIQYNGVYMPYGVLVPANPEPSPAMVVFLHGANQYQNVNPVHFSPTGLVLTGAYDVEAVVIFPNGRTTGWGTPLADRDALDSIDDAVKRLNVDSDRIVLSGVSSGGYGTFHLAARYPDRFAGGFSIVGGPSSAGPVENLHNVPFRAQNGLLDPLVNVGVWRESADVLAAAETVDYRLTLVLNRSHDGPIAEGNCYYLDLLRRRRDPNPARVRYTVLPSAFHVDRDMGLDLRPRGAYWVSELASRDGGPATIDADSLAKVGRTVAGDTEAIDQNATKPADFCGPHPSLQSGNSWQTMSRTTRVAPRRTTNALTVTARNLAAVTVDVARAGLSLVAPVEVKITGDGPTRVTLTGPWKGDVVVLRDGVGVGRADAGRDGRVVLAGDMRGTHTYTVRPAG